MSVPASQAAPLTRQEFVTQLERAAQRLEVFPVSCALLRTLAEVLKQGEPSWWLKTMKAWERRRFVAWNEPWGLFLTALHYEALKDPENPLVRYLPSCGGTPEADPGRAMLRFLSEAEDPFYERLRNGYRRNFVGRRSLMWVVPAAAFFQARNLPFYVVETDSGAGLNLVPPAEDSLKAFKKDLVSARIGLDPEPLALQDIEQRRWLTAAVLPDSVAGIQELDQAAERLLALQRKDPAYVQVAPCPAELAPGFIRKNIPVEKDGGLLLVNMGATGRMSDLEYQAYATEIANLMREWEGRAIWVEVETVRGELYSFTHQLRVHRLIGGVMSQKVAATFDFGSGRIDFPDKPLVEFLS